MTMVQPGWYPDPLGGPQQRFFDGMQWTNHYAPHVANSDLAPPQAAPYQALPPQSASTFTPPVVKPEERKRNPLFLVLAVLSGIPTAFFGVFYLFNGQSNFSGLLLIWCFIWTWVWWALSDRYR